MKVQSITAKDVIIDFGTPPAQTRRVIELLNLTVETGRFTTLFGVNGSGKSTLVSAFAQLISPTQGEVKFNYADRQQKSIKHRAALLHQDYRRTNFPWLNVFGNVKLALDLARMSARDDEIYSITKSFLPELTGNEFLYHLSGGQQQLVSVARAFAAYADVILADEALSALDAARSFHTIEIIDRIWCTRPVPVLWVSHNLDEGILLADSIALLSKKERKISQILPNKLPRPRTVAMLTSDTHQCLRREVIEFLRGED